MRYYQKILACDQQSTVLGSGLILVSHRGPPLSNLTPTTSPMNSLPLGTPLQIQCTSTQLLSLSLSLSLCAVAEAQQQQKMANPSKPSLLLLLLHLAFSSSSSTTAAAATTTSPDMEPLLRFKSISDTSNTLTNWNDGSSSNRNNPCNWTGVSCQKNNRVYRLVLENLNLHNTFSPLTSLTHLRVLSLKHNSLSGPLPDFSNFTSLRLLFLSHNRLSGPFPPLLLSPLSRLYRLDLSYNNFSGQVPVDGINGLTHLLTLRLEGNRFTGSVSGLSLQNLQDFNVSGNLLYGEVPRSLSGFPASSFGQNPGLCGPPVTACKGGGVGSDPAKPGSEGAIASKPGGSVVSSSPSALPSGASPLKESNKSTEKRTISPIAVIAIVVGDCLVLAIVVLLLFCYFWRKYAVQGDQKRNKLRETEKMVYSSSPYPNNTNGYNERAGKMVFFEGVRRFELEDLLRASAEMLGKGGSGTAYKAVLDDGSVVAVKRLKDAVVGGGGGGGWRMEFEQQMEVLGRLKHPNLVSLKAYYFAREEKLLVYDYMPSGSLFWLLHGNSLPL